MITNTIIKIPLISYIVKIYLNYVLNNNSFYL